MSVFIFTLLSTQRTSWKSVCVSLGQCCVIKIVFYNSKLWVLNLGPHQHPRTRLQTCYRDTTSSTKLTPTTIQNPQYLTVWDDTSWQCLTNKTSDKHFKADSEQRSTTDHPMLTINHKIRLMQWTIKHIKQTVMSLNVLFIW